MSEILKRTISELLRKRILSTQRNLHSEKAFQMLVKKKMIVNRSIGASHTHVTADDVHVLRTRTYHCLRVQVYGLSKYTYILI